MAGGIFISYRREDSAGFARLIYDRVVNQLDRDRVFFDVDNIEPGLDFVKILSARVGACDALVAIIGKNWLTASDDEQKRRIDDPFDFVRIEIEAALQRDIRVIPVLVDGARMPRPSDLPEALKSLSNRQAIEISHTRFESDSQNLTRWLRRLDGQRVSSPDGETPGSDESSRAAPTLGEQNKRGDDVERGPPIRPEPNSPEVAPLAGAAGAPSKITKEDDRAKRAASPNRTADDRARNDVPNEGPSAVVEQIPHRGFGFRRKTLFGLAAIGAVAVVALVTLTFYRSSAPGLSCAALETTSCAGIDIETIADRATLRAMAAKSPSLASAVTARIAELDLADARASISTETSRADLKAVSAKFPALESLVSARIATLDNEEARSRLLAAVAGATDRDSLAQYRKNPDLIAAVDSRIAELDLADARASIATETNRDKLESIAAKFPSLAQLVRSRTSELDANEQKAVAALRDEISGSTDRARLANLRQNPALAAAVDSRTAALDAIDNRRAADAKQQDEEKKADQDTQVSAGREPVLVDTYGDWKVYVAVGDRGRVCYTLADPTDRSPGRRNPSYAFISNRPGEAVHQEVSFIIGASVANIGAATATVDGNPFELLARGSNLWVKDAEKEGLLVDALRNGLALEIKVVSKTGAAITDSYSLIGVSQALTRIESQCR